MWTKLLNTNLRRGGHAGRDGEGCRWCCGEGWGVCEEVLRGEQPGGAPLPEIDRGREPQGRGLEFVFNQQLSRLG